MADPISSVFSALTGGGGVADPKTIELDPATQSLLKKQVDQANQTPEQFSGMLNTNVQSAQNRMSQVPGVGQDQGKTGLNNGMLGAIQNTYASHAQKGINRLTDYNALQGNMQKAEYMKKVSSALMGQEMARANQYRMLTEAYNQGEMARASAINSLFQVANVGMGMYAGNMNKGPKAVETGPGQQASAFYSPFEMA